MKSKPYPDSVAEKINDCEPPEPNYTGMVMNEKGSFSFVNGKPSPGSGIWGEIIYSGYDKEI